MRCVTPSARCSSEGAPRAIAPPRRPEAARLELPSRVSGALAAIESSVEAVWPAPKGFEPARVAARRASLARWALLSVGDDELTNVPAALRTAVLHAERDAHDREADGESPLDEQLITARYAIVDRVVEASVKRAAQARRTSEKIDDVLVHPLWGLLVFAAVMFVVFQALFAWAEPLVGLIEGAVDAVKGAAKSSLPEGPFTDLVTDGIIAGVGNVVVFVPQIAILFVFITLLEDSGYLARVAFVIDRVMAKVGLNGRAFVPLLSGFACAIPAVMATRTIESRRDRLLTMLVVPLSSCSARLPVYVLMTSVVFDPGSRRSAGCSRSARSCCSRCTPCRSSRRWAWRSCSGARC
jgi:ferrous iron transport protein B